ncbi:hypothetical protein BE17_10655 [Sorangium cellulosum]|uniref:Uncharacterized protein n=1 Tax=Sorangium cellulosum TaxID=56 RepID=A0A150RT67_SORCE|nr:hypothetical protein BE17_10655 [Sorangium cellulosum]
MSMDSKESSQAAAAPHDGGPVNPDLTALMLTEEQLASIRQEAVRSAILSVTELRQGRRRCDSLTLGEWEDFASAPGPRV